MKTKVYAGVSKPTGNHVMFYKKPDGQWRLCVVGGKWINVPSDIPNLYPECNSYLVNNFKEKNEDE